MLKFLDNAAICTKHFRYPSTQKQKQNKKNKTKTQIIINFWLGNTCII